CFSRIGRPPPWLHWPQGLRLNSALRGWWRRRGWRRGIRRHTARRDRWSRRISWRRGWRWRGSTEIVQSRRWGWRDGPEWQCKNGLLVNRPIACLVRNANDSLPEISHRGNPMKLAPCVSVATISLMAGIAVGGGVLGGATVYLLSKSKAANPTTYCATDGT